MQMTALMSRKVARHKYSSGPVTAESCCGAGAAADAADTVGHASSFGFQSL